MIPVDDAVARIVSAFAPVEGETVPLRQASGRVLAEDVRARMNQPPAPVSAMDGYALKAADAASVPVTLPVIGTSPAGHPFTGKVGAGQAVRIFTGGVVPEGADTVVMQEDTEAADGSVTIKEAAVPAKHIRVAGLDFRVGGVLAKAGKRLTARDLSLIAAGDLPEVPVRRRPRVALAATGDELSPPGTPHGPGGIVASSGYGLAPLIEKWGGEVIDLGITPDTVEAIANLPHRAAGADLLVTLGGASVGEHDLIQKALGPVGLKLDFWKIAMRPGKPLIFGRLGALPLIGLPGNPVSTLVCAILYLRPAIAAMLGTDTAPPLATTRLAAPLKANDQRQDYIRARLEQREGEMWAQPFSIQDSSMLSGIAAADALIVRRPHAAAAEPGDRVDVLPLADF
ncbi:MAG: molybdopterin molybdotransferase MoeA [Pseudomonadota bacterium]|nr:molybdopterin molybdotransferase MoeA [Pseudomonadota bacterium]